MQLFISTMPTLTISTIYCIWQAYVRFQLRQDSVLRERVTHMLWMAAMQV
jgi:hypothetical protein